MNWKQNISAVFVVVLMSACGDESPQGKVDIPSGNPSIAAVVNILSPGQQCANGGTTIHTGIDENGNGLLDESEYDLTQYVCNGADGASGANALISLSAEAAGSNCASGGIRIEGGLDDNRNAVLDIEEVSTYQFVCNGADGLGGEAGADGNDGATGSAGTDGNDGLTSLVTVTAEEAGDNCVNGGSKIESGLDLDEDTILDAEEVTSTSYACNGIDVIPEPKIAIAGDSANQVLAGKLREMGLAVDSFTLSPSLGSDIDGDLVVWQDRREDAVGDIYAYDLSTETRFKVNKDQVGSMQKQPVVSGDLVVWIDNRDTTSDSATDIYAWDRSTDSEFRVNQGGNSYRLDQPDVDGDLIVWRDNRHAPDESIYAYDLSTDTLFKVNKDTPQPTKRKHPVVSGDVIVWSDKRDGEYNLYAYDISEDREFRVNQGRLDVPQTGCAIDGNIIVWTENRGAYAGVYMYDLSTDTETKIESRTSLDSPTISGDHIMWASLTMKDGVLKDTIQAYNLDTATIYEVGATNPSGYKITPKLSGERVVWADKRNIDRAKEIYLYDLSTGLERDLSSAGKDDYTALIDRIADYKVILFGDDQTDSGALALFDAASEAGVPMLGIGTKENKSPLGYVLFSVYNNLVYRLEDDEHYFAMETGDEVAWAPMHITIVPEEQEHPIFVGLEVDAPLLLEEDPDRIGLWDEQYYDTDITDAASPADWTVLATFGDDMGFAGKPAIVEFTTHEGTRVMLDGSANTSDGYEFWAQSRWDVLYNQLVYLMDSTQLNDTVH